jgi:hypothetical protein
MDTRGWAGHLFVELEGSTPEHVRAIDCDDRRMRFINGWMDYDVYWHSVAWARLHVVGDWRPETQLIRDAPAGGPPIFLMLQTNRPPYPRWHVPGGRRLFDPNIKARPLSLALGEVATRCAPSAVDPSALLLLAMSRLVWLRLEAGESSPALSAANDLNVRAVVDHARDGADAMLAAIASCLAGRLDPSGRLLIQALERHPDSWALLLARALRRRSEGDTDALGLLAPVLRATDLPAELAPALGAAASSGVECWYNPFL